MDSINPPIDTLFLYQIINNIHDILNIYTTGIIPLTEIPLPLSSNLSTLTTLINSIILQIKQHHRHQSPSSIASLPIVSSDSIPTSLQNNLEQLYIIILSNRRLLWDIIHSDTWKDISIHYRLWYLVYCCYESYYSYCFRIIKKDCTIQDILQCIDIGYMLGPSPVSSIATDNHHHHDNDNTSSINFELPPILSEDILSTTLSTTTYDNNSIISTKASTITKLITIRLHHIANKLITKYTDYNLLQNKQINQTTTNNQILSITIPEQTKTNLPAYLFLFLTNHSTIQLPSPSPLLSLPSFIIPIKRLVKPSIQEFYQHYLLTDTPVILTGIIDNWPAYNSQSSRYWGNLSYLLSTAGLRTVPIEIGTHYMDNEWSTKLMTIEKFIKQFILKSSDTKMEKEDKEISSPLKRSYTNNNDTNSISNNHQNSPGYLAQFPLFDYIPLLRNDISIPDYCGLLNNNTNTTTSSSSSSLPPSYSIQEPEILAWFGPANTISNLHYDTSYNLLTQIIGYKRIRIYSEEYTSLLYPYDGLMKNTSQINLELYDTTLSSSSSTTTSSFPLFTYSSIPHYDFILQPGEILYIPPYYWHYVRSLTISFSVSFWWS